MTYECGHESCTIDYEEGDEEGNCPACEDDLSNSDEESSFNSSDDDDEEDSEAEEEERAEAKAEEEARKEDVKLIQSMMGRIKDSTVKAMLQDIVDDPEGKKRYLNTCGVCRCDRVS